MYEVVQAVLNSEEKIALRQLIEALSESGNRYFLRNEILLAFADYCHRSQKPGYFYRASSLGKLIHHTHEIMLESDNIWLIVRPWIASQQIWRWDADLEKAERMTPQALLEARDRLVNRAQPQIFELDVSAFYKDSPEISDPRTIGQGLEFLNHYLCDELQTNPQYWLDALFEALHLRQYNDIPLLVNDRIHNGQKLREQVQQALRFLRLHDPDAAYADFHPKLQEMGLEPGWGNTIGRACETLELLDRLIDSPQPAILEAFVSRVPAIFRVVLVSVHGWVGQESVLGRPETAGQVAYVLDQARSLENKLREDIQIAGLDLLGIQPQVVILTRLIPNCEGTQCGLRLEKIDGTEHGWILRVPFQEFNPNVTQNWISKFEIFPYLESFALDAEAELLKQLQGRPNLIIGNYTDGNLVAFLLARRLKTLHCNIAHSLEKPKYLFSNLYWQDLEDQYHFSAQFTADLISMNAADFVITSSYQEIVGTPETVGQYESYKCFTMPQLYHVVDGVNLFHPKFNRVPPGVNETFFFPYTQTEDRRNCTRIQDLIFQRQSDDILGNLQNSEKRSMLAVSPINAIKNLAGLVECFAKNQELQDKCNLILVTNKIHASAAKSPEEADEIAKLHHLIDHYQLHDRLRWIGIRLPSEDLGEVYRAIADKGGIFVHFARFEAFGRTILEAMISGLPTFATEFGGAVEIIQDEENGFLINPTDFESSTQKILQFLQQCDADAMAWKTLSDKSIHRIREQYNWRLHTERLLAIAKVYGFGSYISRDSREPLMRYLEALFHLLYKPRADLILEQHKQR
ncbi:sucrose synthase [Phormidesmis sp. 146-35]